MELRTFLILNFLSCVQLKEKHKLSCKKIRGLVDGHNARRLLIAEGKVPGHPAASEMKKVVWDEELYEKAAKWANRNETNEALLHSHNLDNSVPSARFATGENLYWYTTTDLKYKLNPEKALEDWFLEYKNFTFAPLQELHFSADHPEIGHYTQMVWSDSIYIGCAISKSKTLKQGWKSFFVVCNYGPQGNYIGETPYKAEAGASGKLLCDHENCIQPYGSKCRTFNEKKELSKTKRDAIPFHFDNSFYD